MHSVLKFKHLLGLKKIDNVNFSEVFHVYMHVKQFAIEWPCW